MRSIYVVSLAIVCALCGCQFGVDHGVGSTKVSRHISLTREFRVGDVFDVDIIVTDDTVTHRSHGDKMSRTYALIKLSGRVEVLGVDSLGRATSQKITVSSMTASMSPGDDPQEVLLEGAVINVAPPRGEDESPYVIEGVEVKDPQELSNMLSMAVPEYSHRPHISDKNFGIDSAVAVGQQWDVNPDFVEEMRTKDTQVDQFSGVVSFLGPVKTDGHDAISVEMRLHFGRVVPTSIPNGITADSSLDIKMHRVYPARGRLPAMIESCKSNYRIALTDGSETTTIMRHQSCSIRRRMVSAK